MLAAGASLSTLATASLLGSTAAVSDAATTGGQPSSTPSPSSTDAALPGIGQRASAVTGTGKLYAEATPLPGSAFPVGAPFTGPITFTLATSSGAAVSACPEDFDPYCDLAPGDYVATQTAPAPVGFLPDPHPVDVVIPDSCELSADSQARSDQEDDCDVEVNFLDPGAYRTLAVHLRNLLNGDPVPGAGYELCGPEEILDARPAGSGPAVVDSDGCAAPSSALASGVTGAGGTVTFPGLYLPGSYSVVETTVPAHYRGDTAARPLTVPAAITAAQAAQPVVEPDTNLELLPPGLHDQTFSIPEDSSQLVSLFAGAADEDQAVTFTAINNPRHGALLRLSQPPSQALARALLGSLPSVHVTYVPDAGFVGTDQFSFSASDGTGTSTATVVIHLIDIPPTAKSTTVTAPASGPADTDVLSLAGTVSGNTLTLLSVGKAAHGTVTILPGGKVSYTADPGFVGTDTFRYTVTDGKGGVASATVTVIVPASLPFTGYDSLALLEWAMLLASGGVALLGGARRLRLAYPGRHVR